MKGTGKKLRSGKGFSLVEMLIVVAIIAVLVAVSIPLVDASMERVRDATDQANERAAKALAFLAHMGLDDSISEVRYAYSDPNDPIDFSSDPFYLFDAEAGKLREPKTAGKITPYGQCTKQHTGEHLFESLNWGIGTEDEGEHEGRVLWVYIFKDGSAKLSWSFA